MRPFGGNITALAFSASMILMACMYHPSKMYKPGCMPISVRRTRYFSLQASATVPLPQRADGERRDELPYWGDLCHLDTVSVTFCRSRRRQGQGKASHGIKRMTP